MQWQSCFAFICTICTGVQICTPGSNLFAPPRKVEQICTPVQICTPGVFLKTPFTWPKYTRGANLHPGLQICTPVYFVHVNMALVACKLSLHLASQKSLYFSIISVFFIMSPPDRVGRHIVFPRASVCLSVCLSVRHKLCPLYNLKTFKDFSMKLGTLVNHDKTMCHAQEP